MRKTMNLTIQRPLLGMTVFGLLGGFGGLALHAIANADKPPTPAEPKRVSLELRYLRTE